MRSPRQIMDAAKHRQTQNNIAARVIVDLLRDQKLHVQAPGLNPNDPKHLAAIIDLLASGILAMADIRLSQLVGDERHLKDVAMMLKMLAHNVKVLCAESVSKFEGRLIVEAPANMTMQ